MKKDVLTGRNRSTYEDLMKVKESCFYPKRSWLRRPRNTAIRRCVTVALLVLGLVVGGTSPGWADTKTGVANRATIQQWSFLNGGTGETKVTLSWTNGNAYLLMILTCGTDPLVFGVAASGLNRYAEITAGVPQNTSCVVAVTTLRGASSYRIHLNQTVSEASRPAGRGRLAVPTASDGDLLAWYAQMELDRLRLSLEP